MKVLTVTTAILVAAPAWATAECDRASIGREGRALGRQAARVEQLARAIPSYRRVAVEANGLANGAVRVADAAFGNTACHRLRLELESDLRPQLDDLQQAEAQAQAQRPSPAVAQTMERVLDAFDRLAAAADGAVVGPMPGQPPILVPVPPTPGPGQPPVIVPVPPVLPPPSPCQRVVGVYTGVCRASAGVTAMSFQVVNTGAACVATNATYFAPLAMAFDGANFFGSPVSNGSVAIRDTRLVVSGNGQFVFTGYNYAGRFWFQCTPH